MRIRIEDVTKDIASLKVSYDKINHELGMINQNITEMRTNYQWIKWLVVLIAG